MSTKNASFDLGVAQAAVQLDTAGVLGKFLDGKFWTELVVRGRSQDVVDRAKAAVEEMLRDLSKPA